MSKDCIFVFCIMESAREKIIAGVRDMVPALKLQMNGERLVYLDNAATTQKPVTVLDFLSTALVEGNANVHRSMYELSDRSTQAYEAAREKVRAFINAPSRENIIFTSGTTASINLVADTFCRRLKKGDVVLIEADSHHSNIVPWQLAAERNGAETMVIPTDVMTGAGRSGRVAVEELDKMLSERVKLLAITHISNITGLHNPVSEIIEKAHRLNIPVLVDGAQGIVHQGVDVQKMDCDFYAFSAHKIYGATGVGILYGKKEILESLPPYMGGGDMVETVTYRKTTYAPLPLRFEAGTPNFIGAASLTPALEFAEYLSEGETGRVLKEEEARITDFMMDYLSSDSRIKLYGIPQEAKVKNICPANGTLAEKAPIFTFNIESINAGDLAQLLDKMGIAVRSGMMCAEPLLNSFGVPSALRASFAPYNTLDEAKIFVKCLERARAMLS